MVYVYTFHYSLICAWLCYSRRQNVYLNSHFARYYNHVLYMYMMDCCVLCLLDIGLDPPNVVAARIMNQVRSVTLYTGCVYSKCPVAYRAIKSTGLLQLKTLKKYTDTLMTISPKINRFSTYHPPRTLPIRYLLLIYSHLPAFTYIT